MILKVTNCSGGIGIGSVVLLTDYTKVETHVLEDVSAEKDRFLSAVEKAKEELINLMEKLKDELESDKLAIFEAQISILEDPELINDVLTNIEENKVSAENALKDTIEKYVNIFKTSNNPYLQERVLDLFDIQKNVLNTLNINSSNNIEIDNNSVLAANDILPSDLARINRKLIEGIIIGNNSAVSHTAILAKSMGIPVVFGVGNVNDLLKRGDLVILDCLEGNIYINPDEETILKYKQKKQQLELERLELEKYKKVIIFNRNNKRIKIGAILNHPVEIDAIVEKEPDEIGLFRTEFLFMNQNNWPSEDEQFNEIKKIIQKMNGKPVTIRTFDIGGDKTVPFIKIDKEENPFLGLRGARLYRKYKEEFKTHIKAILRASAYGNIRILVPMITTADEVREIKKVIEEVKKELEYKGLSFSSNIEFGIMVEVPACALTIEQFKDEVDFFSVGTNDLTQYVLAVDRTNNNVSYLYDKYPISLEKLIRYIIEEAHKIGKWVGICGEIASDENIARKLLDIGVDELAVRPDKILSVKKTLAENLN